MAITKGAVRALSVFGWTKPTHSVGETKETAITASGVASREAAPCNSSCGEVMAKLLVRITSRTLGS